MQRMKCALEDNFNSSYCAEEISTCENFTQALFDLIEEKENTN